MSGPLVLVCGLKAEAKIARGPGLVIVTGGGDQARLAADLQRLAAEAKALISFGICGGLAPDLSPGALLVAEAVIEPSGERLETDARWRAVLTESLGIAAATFAGVDTPLTDPAGKARLRAASGAAVVDMETHIAARVAARFRLPFAALRAVTDSARHELPHAAATSMRPDGSVDIGAVVRSLARDPRQLPGLIRTGLDTRRAFAALLRSRERLGPDFAFLDLGEPLLHVP